MGYPELSGFEAKREDGCIHFALRSCVGHPSQRTEYKNIAGADNLGTGIDITKDNHITVVMQALTGTNCPAHQECVFRLISPLLAFRPLTASRSPAAAGGAVQIHVIPDSQQLL